MQQPGRPVPTGLLTEPVAIDVEPVAPPGLSGPLDGPLVDGPPSPTLTGAAPLESGPASVAMSHAAAGTDSRPVYRVAVFGLGARFHRLLGLITRHAGSNRFRFELADRPGPGEFDIAIVDMTSRGGAEVARTLRGVPRAMPVIAVGRRGSLHRRGKDDLLFDSFSSEALNVLNDAADSLHGRELSEEAVAASAMRLPRFKAPATGRSVPRVLVLDQSTAVRNQVAMALRHLGVDVEGVSTLTQARDVLSMRSYDLMVIEPMQPDGNGFEFVRSLRHDDSRRRMPVIILSHRHSMLDLCKGALAGCDGYLAKPVALSTLHATVHRVLKRSWPAASPQAAARRRGEPLRQPARSTTALQ